MSQPKDNDIETLVAGSFLRHVPEIMVEQGCSLDEAIRIAYDRDEVFLAEMTSLGVGLSGRAKVVREVLSERIYNRIRNPVS